MLNDNLRRPIRQLWDKFWSGGLSNPITAIEQISYLLFMKRLDENDARNKKKGRFSGKKYVTIFPDEKLRWSKFSNEPDPEKLLKHVRETVFPFIKNMHAESEPFSRHMKDAVFLVPKPSLLTEAIGIIDTIYKEIERQETDDNQGFQDTLGDVYEHLLNEIATAGKNGQFRTPRHLMRMIAEVVNPQFGHRICDPTCGTGGFLLAAYQHILSVNSSKKFQRTDENGFVNGKGDLLKDERAWNTIQQDMFFGYDFDPTMVRFGLMNLMLHDVTHPKIENIDTLSKRFENRGNPLAKGNPMVESLDKDQKQLIQKAWDENPIIDRFNIILANPPFKGSIDTSDQDSRLRIDSSKTELLFLDRIMLMLEVGGKAGVILPDGVLFGGSKAHKQVRELLLSTCQLDAVISLPGGVFKPYAGVKTSVLIFTKALEDQPEKLTAKGKGYTSQKVWFYELQSDGYTLDDKRNPISINESEQHPLPAAVTQWNKRKDSPHVEKEEGKKDVQHFYVSIQQLIEEDFDLTFQRYKPIYYEEVKYDPPKDILEKLINAEQEILSEMEELRGMIG
jgi:type I restriction enzyme M protein